jgi:hypothetical protein
VRMLFVNSLRDAGPRAAEGERRRAARELFGTPGSFDLNMTIAQILQTGSLEVTGAPLTGRCAAEVVPRRPGGWGWTEGKPQFVGPRNCGVVPLHSATATRPLKSRGTKPIRIDV